MCLFMIQCANIKCRSFHFRHLVAFRFATMIYAYTEIELCGKQCSIYARMRKVHMSMLMSMLVCTFHKTERIA